MRSPNGGFISAFYDPLKTPNAPTIGTATAVSGTSVSVAFTAPANIGGSAITSYMVLSSGGQTATGTTSPIVVTGLTTGTGYTFTVVATNSYGTGPRSAASNSATPLMFGDAFEGGFYAGNIVQGGTTYRVIVAPRSTGESTSLAYKTTNDAAPAATQTLNNGPAASASMNSADYPAAQFCEALSIGGYTDWYLPARDELELCYRNLKPTTTTNNTAVRGKSSITYPEGNDVTGNTMGTNLNSSPTGAAYTSGNPAQTTASAFITGQSQAFSAVLYRCSSEFSTSAAWMQNFSTGEQESVVKSPPGYVRAVRRVAL